MLLNLSFVLGGAASGKSLFAENLILNSGLTPHYIATSRIWDDETKSRVEVHKSLFLMMDHLNRCLKSGYHLVEISNGKNS